MEIQIEQAFKEIKTAIFEAIKSNTPSIDNVYACGFWLFYCDYEMLGTPCFAYNSEGTYEEDCKWCPPEWSVDVADFMTDALSPHYEKLSELMIGKTDEEWEELIDFQFSFYCQLCHDINEMKDKTISPFNEWKTTNDFVIGVFEEREGEELYNELVQHSVGSERGKSLAIC